MNRFQLSPISIVRDSQIEPSSAVEREHAFERDDDACFLRSWLVYDSGQLSGRVGLNGNAVLGIVLAVVVSLSVWVGIGMLISRSW